VPGLAVLRAPANDHRGIGTAPLGQRDDDLARVLALGERVPKERTTKARLIIARVARPHRRLELDLEVAFGLRNPPPRAVGEKLRRAGHPGRPRGVEQDPHLDPAAHDVLDVLERLHLVRDGELVFRRAVGSAVDVQKAGNVDRELGAIAIDAGGPTVAADPLPVRGPEVRLELADLGTIEIQLDAPVRVGPNHPRVGALRRPRTSPTVTLAQSPGRTCVPALVAFGPGRLGP